MNIPDSEIYNASLSFDIKGIADSRLFPVRLDEADRVQLMLSAAREEPAGDKMFAVFETSDGWTVAVRLDSVESVYVLIDPIEHAPEYEPAEPGVVRIHFGDTREPLCVSPAQPEDSALLELDLDAGLETIPRRFLSLSTEDNELVYIGTDHVLLVEIEGTILAEGHRILAEELEELPELPEPPAPVSDRED